MDVVDKLKDSFSQFKGELDEMGKISKFKKQISMIEEEITDYKKELGDLVYTLGFDQVVSDEKSVNLLKMIKVSESRIDSVKDKIAELEAEEKPGSVPVYGHICPECQKELKPDAVFCPTCGSTAVDVEPPKESEKLTCVSCGFEIAEGGKFCVNCGTKAEEPKVEQEPEPEPAVNLCPQCQYENTPNSIFCFNCGTKLSTDS